MTKNAERQAQFRANLKTNNFCMFQSVISKKSRANLDFIARSCGRPLNQTIEMLIADAVGQHRLDYERAVAVGFVPNFHPPESL